MNWGWDRSFRLERDSRGVLGLDIGLSSVKIVRLCKSKEEGSYAVTSCGLVDIAAEGGDGGDHWNNLLGRARAIHECLELTGVKARYAVCGLSGPEVAVRDFEFPAAIPQEEIEGAVLLEASQVCPFNTEDSTVDYQLISRDEEKIRGILVAATNSLIKSTVSLVRDASLSCVLMDVGGLALLNCFTEVERPEAGRSVAILNVGGSYSTLAIMGGDGCPFVRDMIYIGHDIVREIAAERDMPLQLVHQSLSGTAEEPQTDLRDSLERACRKLIADVNETLRYYNSQNKGANLAEVFVCGDFAQADGFVEILSEHLAIQAVLWNPFNKMRCQTGRTHKGLLQRNILRKNGPAMVVAAGLAMRSI